VATQGLLLVALGVFLVVRGFGADTTSRGRAETGGLFAVLGGAGFMLLARGVLARRQWARSPTLVCEFLSLPVAYGLLQGHKYAYGVPLAASGLAGLVLLVAASAAGGGRDEQDMRTGHGDDGGT
jgi:peptidoglycan/LPS O-acetylase OafA/YrhL